MGACAMQVSLGQVITPYRTSLPSARTVWTLAKGGWKVDAAAESRSEHGQDSRLTEIPEVTWTFPIYGTS